MYLFTTNIKYIRQHTCETKDEKSGTSEMARVGPKRRRIVEQTRARSELGGLLGTMLALGRVITRFVSRKPPGSTQMRTGSNGAESTLPSYSSRRCFCDNPDDSFSRFFPVCSLPFCSCLQSTVVTLSELWRNKKQSAYHFLPLSSVSILAFVVYADERMNITTDHVDAVGRALMCTLVL